MYRFTFSHKLVFPLVLRRNYSCTFVQFIKLPRFLSLHKKVGFSFSVLPLPPLAKKTIAAVSYFSTINRTKPYDFCTIPARRVCNMPNASSSDSNESVIIACVQLTSTEDKDKNFQVARELILKAKEQNAKMVFLPEAFDYIGRSKEESAKLSETLNGPLIKSYQQLAKQLDLWLSLGGFHERQEEIREGELPWMTNNHVLIDQTGEIQSVYRKVHLFDVVIPEENVYLQESAFIRAGNEIVRPVKTPIGNLGLGICYDMRFPQFSLALRSLGADVLTFPSAFTVPTGQAHWESLLRARAIETQCFVIAAAQSGMHNSKRSSYGHSLIIDPWGKVLADANEDVGIITAEINIRQIESIRKKMPILKHQRPELYEPGEKQLKFSIPLESQSQENFPFGHVSVSVNSVFLESKHARAFVNKKCVVPGHVLVSPKRVAKRMCDLSADEVGDMFQLAQKVQIIMESVHNATSSTIAVQDGRDAGQTIEHVHIHVLPRKPGDFKENDEIYDKLQKHDKGENVKWRAESEMTAESTEIRTHVAKQFSNLIN